VVEAAGFPAIATSSAAVAATLGYDDGEGTPAEEMFDAVARICSAVGAPVTADLERGYGLPPAELVERLLAAGAVGLNLEDSDPASGHLVDASRQAEYLAAVRDAARGAGVPVVINARIDTYLRGPATGRVEETIARGRRYRAAGADCVFPIRASDLSELREIVVGIEAPVNVLVRPTPERPSLAALAGAGVARVSYGHTLQAAVLRHFADVVAALDRPAALDRRAALDRPAQ
jgi:2-methylisocitrate lyase-like PEP mutase family enzyme